MKLKLTIALLLSLTTLISCSSGGNDDDGDSGDSLSRNACSTIGLSTRIITGSECSENNSPVVEILLFQDDGRGAICSGTMLTSRTVLTAAHCFFERPNRVVVTAAGISVDGTTVNVHPDVRVDEANKAVFNDVAIITLASDVTLPTLPIVASRSVVAGDEIAIYGYGQTEEESDSNSTSGRLRSGEMKVTEVNANFVDALFTGEGSNTCSGDSGGPAIIEVNGQPGIAAVTSSGAIVDCGAGDLSRFANVQGASILDFITRIVPNVGVI